MIEKTPKNPLENDPKSEKEAAQAGKFLRNIVEEENKEDVKTQKIGERNLKEAECIIKETEEERLERIIRERKFFPPSEIPAEKREKFDEIKCTNCGGTGFDGTCEACGGEGRILALKKEWEEHEDWLGIGS